MSHSKFGPIWGLLSKYNFAIDVDSANADLICVICKNVVVDSVVSNVCGCQYCYKCVNDYTSGENKYCPGIKEDCKDEHILFDKNAFRSVLLNKKVSKLKINCPNKSCGSKVELIEMEDHLRLCMKQAMECPYVSIGCDSEISDKESIVTHLHCNTFPHTELLLELIQNMKNELNVLRSDFAKSKLEIVSLKEDLSEVRNEIEIKKNLIEQKQEIETLQNDMENSFEKNKFEIENLKERLENKENRIVTLEEELRQVRNEIEIRVTEERDERKNEQRRQSEDARKEIECVTTMVNDLRKDVNEMVTEERDERKNEQRLHCEDARMERENVTTMVNDLKKDVNEMREERKNSDDGREKQLNNLFKLCPNIGADFVWRFDQCSENINTEIFSESFYADNYKLCLSVYINRSDNLGVYCWIMKGDNDDKVQWPMRRAVTISIVDQCTLTTHKSGVYESSFDRPKNDIGEFVGRASFIKYSSIKDKASIIVVSCVITDP